MLLAAAAVALVCANSPFGAGYEAFWTTELDIPRTWGLPADPRHWVNDALMTLFFLVVGLEIKRELVRGELQDRRKAVLPAIAAVGGMVGPALLYAAFNAGGPGAAGWGIPIATDIAFTIGALALLGTRIPPGLKIFLLSLAIADDIGAIAAIALFYAEDLDPVWLGAAGAVLIAIAVLLRSRPLGPAAYLLLGTVLWYLTLRSGVHATIAGVALAFVIPLDAEDGSSVAERLETGLHPWTSYLVVPLFALANAGVRLDGGSFVQAWSSPVTVGVFLGLVVGKPVGILLAVRAATALRLGRLPEGVTGGYLVGGAILAGIGFTVSLFVAELAFSDPVLVDVAKIGVLSGSVVAALVGMIVLATRARRD